MVVSDTSAVVAAFNLADAVNYQHWREAKLARRVQHANPRVIELADPFNLSAAECEALTDQCRHYNWVIYRLTNSAPINNPAVVAAIGDKLGLTRLDSNLCADNQAISTLQDNGDSELKAGYGYIPYTNRQLNWHSDGYYNTHQYLIRAFILHCAQDAAEGGENSIIDPDIVYIRLRDRCPDLLPALFAGDAMTIPANSGIRGKRSGSVFSFNSTDGSLHLRYTARTRSINWKQDDRLQPALEELINIINTPEDQTQIRLTPGQGIICNNVLHTRSAYTDNPGQPRTLFRARYYDRVNNTGPETIINNLGTDHALVK